MSEQQSHIARLYSRTRQRRLRTITVEVRQRLHPFSEGLDPETFEEEIALMAERRLAEQEEGMRPGPLSPMTPV